MNTNALPRINKYLDYTNERSLCTAYIYYPISNVAQPSECFQEPPICLSMKLIKGPYV